MRRRQGAPVKRLGLRLDPDLYDWLVALARREERTLSEQVTYILRRFREQERTDAERS